MAKAFELIPIGLDKNEETVYLPRYHTLIAGSTGTGKTEATRKFIEELKKAIPDLKVLIFDVKSTGRDWEGYGVDVPPYVETATDSRFLRDLIETSEGRKIDWFFYELHIACEGAETWEGVLANLEKRYEKYKGKVAYKEEKIGTLLIYMRALTKELREAEISTEIDLSNEITVVPLNFREEAFKHLVVYSYLNRMRKMRVKRMVVVCDEASSLAPGREGTGCKKIIEHYLFKQGRAAEVFGIASDQEITGISPTIRRQCWNWLLGMQTDTTAQKRTVDLIPGKTIDTDEISTLGVGWWYAVIRTPSKTEVRKFYLLPEGVDLETARKVVRGELEVEYVMETVAQLRKGKKEDEDLVYKEKWEEEKRKREELEKGFEKKVKGLKGRITKLEMDRERLKKDLGKAGALIEKLSPLEKDVEAIQRVKEAIRLLLPAGPPGFEPEIITELEEKARAVSKDIEQIYERVKKLEETPSIVPQGHGVTLAEIDERINQRVSEKKEVRIVKVDIDERLKEIVKNHVVQAILGQVKSLPETARRAAPFLYQRKEATVGDLNVFLYDKPGRPSGAFYNNVVIPLQEAHLITRDKGQLRWTFGENLKAKLGNAVSEQDFEKIRKYILSFLM